MAVAQALDFRDHTFGKGVIAARNAIRKHVEHLDEDRPLYDDHNKMKKLVQSNDILIEVEDCIGELH